jgi:8-oxo-dGTP pyrophosphatase MutT (NUDIX family)
VTPPDLDDGVVRAAGGILLRPGPTGEAEVLLVHRPRYDDWSWPKGKCDPGESYEDCARREVEEETGIAVDLREPLPDVRYRDQKDRPKLVRYWVMQPRSEPGPFEPNDEVDEIAWLPAATASERLTYDHDRGLLAGLRRLI